MADIKRQSIVPGNVVYRLLGSMQTIEGLDKTLKNLEEPPWL
jgi:hypothetical protein